MTGFKYIGFKSATVEKRGLTVGELRHRICNVYLNHPEQSFILLCIDDGQRLELNSMKDALSFEWSDNCRIEVINMPHTFGVVTDGKMEAFAPCIIVLQMAEEGEDTVI